MSFNQKGQTKKLLKFLKRIENPCCDCPDISKDEDNIIQCRTDGLFAENSGGNQGFTITAAAALTSLTDGAINYFLSDASAQLGASYDQKSVTIIKNCILSEVLVDAFSGTAGTNEAWSMYIRVNDTTDYLIATVSNTATKRKWINTAINITLNQNDVIAIKVVNPAWVTNPSSTRFTGYLIFTLP